MPREPWRDSLDLPDQPGGGPRSFFQRVFGRGDNPLTWALPLYTALGIRVRLHLLFIVMVVAQLAASFFHGPGSLGPAFVAPVLVGLFGIVLLHEYGHCFACRLRGGEADEILMWPLGGLAMCRPPERWHAHLITTLGGPAVNVALFPLLGVAAWLAAGTWRAAVFNPFDPSAAIAGFGPTPLPFLVVAAVWSIHYANLIILGFNLLIPMYPLDGGRVLHAVLWRRLGKPRATRLAASIGLGVAGVLAVAGLVFGETTLLAVALFGGLMCYAEIRTLNTLGEIAGEPFATAADHGPPEPEPGPTRSEIKRAERDAAEAREIDRILAKISDAGIASLSRRERSALERARKRRASADRDA